MRVQFAHRFSKARSVLSWSQAQTAKWLGWTRRQVIDFEKARARLTEENMSAVESLEIEAFGERSTGTNG